MDFSSAYTSILSLILRFVNTHNTLLILPPERIPKSEPKNRFEYGFMHSLQDRIEAKHFAVSRVLVLRLEHDFIPIDDRDSKD
jgi:hypothetical protein